jgi:hypothetical protein
MTAEVPDAWAAVEDRIAEVGTLAAEADRYRWARAGDGPALLNESLALGATARRLLRDAAGAAGDPLARLLTALRDLAGRYRTLLDAVHGDPEYRAAVAAWAAGDAPTLARTIPAVFADVEPAPTCAALYHPVTVAGRRGRLAAAPTLAAELETMCTKGLVAAEGGAIPATDASLRAVPLHADWAALDTPVALRVDPRTIPLPVFRIAASRDHLVYTERLRARATVVLARHADPQRWPELGVDYVDFFTAMTAALAARNCTVEIRAP